MIRHNLALLFATLLMAACVGVYSANATIIHSDVSGTTADFTGIAEFSGSDPEPLYGQPTAAGDSLDFPLGTFTASSLDGSAFDLTDGILALSISSHDGYVLDSFKVQEGGLTALSAPFGIDAYTQVINFVVYQVIEIAGVPVADPVSGTVTDFVPTNQFLYSSLRTTDPVYLSTFAGQAVISLPADTTKVNVIIYNQLFAATFGEPTSATISKLNFGITAITRLVPEPTTTALGAMSLLIAVSVTRRKPG